MSAPRVTVAKRVVEVVTKLQQGIKGAKGDKGDAGEGLAANQQAALDAKPTLSADNPVVAEDDLSPYALKSELLATKYAPVSVTVVAGTLASGTIADILAADDGQTVRVDEAAGGLTVEIRYEGVVEFTAAIERIQYVGGASHILQRQVYNWLTSTWDLIGEFTGSLAGLTWMTTNFPDSAAYVGSGENAGVVLIRRAHVAPFNPAHYLLIDYAGLVSSVGGVAVGGPTQLQAEDVAGDGTTLYSWNLQRLKQFVTAWWATIVGSVLGTTAGIYATQTASFTITADMRGKDVPCNITDGVITLPAWDGVGFGNGFQCKIVNLNATELTYSGTVAASGTKQAAYSSRVPETIADTWFVGGLT